MNSAVEDVFAQRAVAVDEIGRALSTMWRTADTASGAAGESAVVRARALTLIAIARSEHMNATANAVNSAIAVVPARSIVVELASDSGDVIDAEVGGTCTIGGGGGKRFCQEQVVLRAATGRKRDLPSILVGLAVSDLPCVLYLPDPAAIGDELVARLLPILDVVVVDSSAADEVAPAFDHAVRLENIERVIVRDLAFERLRPMRESIAAAYDDVAKADARVTAVSMNTTKDNAEDLLLLGWIESRFEGGERPFVRYRRNVDASAIGGARCEIVLEVNDEERRYEIRFRRFDRAFQRVFSHEERVGDDAQLHKPLVDTFTALTRVLADPIRSPYFDEALRAALSRLAKGHGG